MTCGKSYHHRSQMQIFIPKIIAFPQGNSFLRSKFLLLGILQIFIVI